MTVQSDERVDLFSHDGLKKRLWKDRAVAQGRKRRRPERVRAFSDGCTLVKVPAFTANDPVFVFIASMRHLSRYFRLTPALNGSIDISRAMCVRTYRSVYTYVCRRVWNACRICKRVLCAYILYHRIALVEYRWEEYFHEVKESDTDELKGGKKN